MLLVRQICNTSCKWNKKKWQNLTNLAVIQLTDNSAQWNYYTMLRQQKQLFDIETSICWGLFSFIKAVVRLFFGLKGFWGQPPGRISRLLFNFTPWMLYNGLPTYQKVLYSWKLVGLKMLDFSDRTGTCTPIWYEAKISWNAFLFERHFLEILVISCHLTARSLGSLFFFSFLDCRFCYKVCKKIQPC